MIAMAADGSQERFLTRKFLPFTAIFVLVGHFVVIIVLFAILQLNNESKEVRSACMYYMYVTYCTRA